MFCLFLIFSASDAPAAKRMKESNGDNGKSHFSIACYPQHFIITNCFHCFLLKQKLKQNPFIVIL